jgi:chitin synthase
VRRGASRFVSFIDPQVPCRLERNLWGAALSCATVNCHMLWKHDRGSDNSCSCSSTTSLCLPALSPWRPMTPLISPQYNEHNPAFPPPPIGLPPDSLTNYHPGGNTLGMDEMASILEQGFDDPPPGTGAGGLRAPDRSYTPSPLQRQVDKTPSPVRYQLSDGAYGSGPNGSNGNGNGYAYGAGSYGAPPPPGGGRARTPDLDTPQPDSGNSVNSISSSIESRPLGVGHAKKRSGGAGQERYGPLGPLADDDTGWGGGYKGRKI